MVQEENRSGAGNSGSALSKLLSDPEALKSIAALAGAFGNGGGNASGAESSEKAMQGNNVGFKVPSGLFEDLPEGPQNMEDDDSGGSIGSSDASESVGDSGDLLGSLISSEMFLKLPEIIAAVGPLMQSFGRLREDGTKGGKAFHRGRVSADKRCALLAAMKPYLSEHRCNTVDMMISLSKFSSIFERK